MIPEFTWNNIEQAYIIGVMNNGRSLIENFPQEVENHKAQLELLKKWFDESQSTPPVSEQGAWEAIRKIIKDRIFHFQTRHHKYEAGMLTMALKAINELIPPDSWLQSQSSNPGNNLTQKYREALEQIRGMGIKMLDWRDGYIEMKSIATEALSLSDKEDGWISIDKISPVYNTEILVTNGNRVKSAMFMKRTSKDEPRFVFTTMKDITHWQPLPSPPPNPEQAK